MLPFRVQWHPGTSRGTFGSRVERLEKRATNRAVCACVGRTPLLSGMIFFRFLFFSTARTREQGWETCRKGGEKCLMRRGEFAQYPSLKFGKISIRIIFGIGDIEWRDWNGNKVDLPIAKYILEIPSLGIYGSDNSNWSNGEDLLARHVRSCTSKSC